MIYEEKNALSEETCNDMISWFDNKMLYGDTGMNYSRVDVQGRKDISLSECQQFGSFKPFYNKINSIIHKHMVHYINEFNMNGFIVGITIDHEGQMTTQANYCKNYGKLH